MLGDNRLAAALLNARVRVEVEIGRAEISLEDFAKIGNGGVIELDRPAGSLLMFSGRACRRESPAGKP